MLRGIRVQTTLLRLNEFNLELKVGAWWKNPNQTKDNDNKWKNEYYNLCLIDTSVNYQNKTKTKLFQRV